MHVFGYPLTYKYLLEYKGGERNEWPDEVRITGATQPGRS
jgi:hypothetical protein